MRRSGTTRIVIFRRGRITAEMDKNRNLMPRTFCTLRPSRMLKCAVRKARDSSGRVERNPPGKFRSSR